MFTEIKPRQRYRWDDKTVEVDGFVSSTIVSIRDMATGAVCDVPVHELRPVHADRAAPLNVHRIPEARWDDAKRAFSLLAASMDVERIDRATATSLAKQIGCSIRRVQRMRKKLRAACRVSTLVPKRGRKRGSRGLHKKTERAVDGQIRQFYLRREQPSVAALMERIAVACRRAKCPMPSYGAVVRRIAALDPQYVTLKRMGPKAAKQAFGQRAGGLYVAKPLDVVQIDHTRMDLMLVTDDQWREPFMRPWLTLAIDVHSRAILGIYLALHAPSSTSVGLCIAHALLPKDDWLAAQGINAKWPMFGPPKLILTDNATEFRGTAMARGCEEMGITLEHRPVGRPWYGGHVERVIGTLMKRVHLIPGTTFSSVHERGKEYDSKAMACMTLAEAQAWLVNEICNRYHVTYHRGLGMSPLQAWELGMVGTSDNKEAP